MSERGDDVLEFSDVREWVDGATGRVRDGHVAVAIVLAVLGAGLALALVPHTIGAVGGNAIDTGDGIGTPDEGEADAQQLYQNYVTNVTVLFAPSLLVLVGCVVAFVGAARSRGRAGRSRWATVGVTAVAAGVGVGLGYTVFVLGSHLAYGETAQSYVVREFPVTLNLGPLAVNALVLAGTATVGSLLSAGAGTLVAGDDGSEASGSALAADDTDEPDGERTWEGVDGDDEPDGGPDDEPATGRDDESPAPTDGDSGTARPDRVETADRASEYRETGPQAGSDAPSYDPDDRDWDGSGGD